jgi:hypothetical protein
MPRVTQNEINNYKRITGHDHPWAGARSGVQKQKDNRRKKTDNRSESPQVDGGMHEGYVLEVEIHVSDRRRRDLDGALATICDCIVAVGRLLAADTAGQSESEGGSEG